WRYTRPNGKINEMGLGIWPDVPVEKARQTAERLRRIRADGRDPYEVTQRDKVVGRKFEQFAQEWIDINKHGKSAGWPREATNLIVHHGKPLLDLTLPLISPQKVQEALKPLWTTHPARAHRARAMWWQVIQYEKVRSSYHGENPADWRAVQKHLSPKVKITKK